MRPATQRMWMVCVATVLALAATAGPALAQSYTLHLSAPPSATVGQTVIMQATGANPSTDFFTSWLDIHAIPAEVLSTCPAGYLNASQVASSTTARGGGSVAIAQREDVDAAGNFSMPIAFTPTAPGRFLICAYTNDGATGTLAATSVILEVRSASAPGATTAPSGGPASVGKPRVARSRTKLVCSRGTWAGDPTRYSYRWVVNGRARRGATRRTLRVTSALRGRKVKCSVTATNAAGSTTVASRTVRVPR